MVADPRVLEANEMALSAPVSTRNLDTALSGLVIPCLPVSAIYYDLTELGVFDI